MTSPAQVSSPEDHDPRRRARNPSSPNHVNRTITANVEWQPTDADSHGDSESDVALLGSTADQLPQSDMLIHEQQPGFWLAPDNRASLFDSSCVDQDALIPLSDHISSNKDQLQGLVPADNERDALFQLTGDSNTVLDMYINPFLSSQDNIITPKSPPNYLTLEESLMGFREEMEQRIAAIDTYYSQDHSKLIQRCKDDDAGSQVENAAASLLTCSREFIAIIKPLTSASHTSTQTKHQLSTEVALLVLSSYLALMRLFDSLFHRMYKYLCKVPLESYKSLKVKSVLRIGGVSALQDMPLKTYAMGILDAIQSQMHTLERCMGVPAEYCLSDKAALFATSEHLGIFSRPDRMRLFWAVMAQEDLKSHRGSKSYVESIRASIEDSMDFLND